MPIGSLGGLIAGGAKQFKADTLGSLGNALQTGYGLYQTIHGNHQLNKLNANRPQRTTDQNILTNQKIAQNIASEGLPDSAKNYYTENINRSLGSGINAILEGGGDLNMINSLIGGATNSYKSMLAQDAQQKLANQGTLLSANQDVANQNQANWNWNTADPYLTSLATATQQSNSGPNNILNGIRGQAGQDNAQSLNSNNYGDLAKSLGYGGSSNSQYSYDPTSNPYYMNEGGITDTSYPNTPNAGGYSPNTSWALGK